MKLKDEVGMAGSKSTQTRNEKGLDIDANADADGDEDYVLTPSEQESYISLHFSRYLFLVKITRKECIEEGK